MQFNIFASLCIVIAAFCWLGTASGVEPIWLSPTNVDLETPDFDLSNVAESYIAEKGVWTNLTVGAGSRGVGPIMAMDSKGILWILFGQRHFYTTKFSYVYLYNVWNYEPKTDLYRYVWGNNETAAADPRDPGELRVEAATNHPGVVYLSGVTIDNNDNIWFTSYDHDGELWMFNTTSLMFVRMHGLQYETSTPNLGANPGQPAEDVWPGFVEAPCMVTDSENNIWLLAGTNGLGNDVNTVWHFNTTSYLWTYIYGSIDQVSGNATFFGGAWNPGCFIDEDDVVWMYGGYGPFGDDSFDLSSLWTFDTRGKREYELQFAPNVFPPDALYPVIVADNYNPGNSPGGCEGCIMIDRMDGTSMLFASSGYATTKETRGTNNVWQYSKSLKQWRHVSGDISATNSDGVYSNYRTPGSSIPGIVYNARTDGRNFNGDLYIVGGSRFNLDTEQPCYKDIWLIPNDQCASVTANKCDMNADCIEEMIGYSCVCKQGYTGDGFTCIVPPVADSPVSVSTPVAVPQSANTPTKKTSSASTSYASVIAVALVALAHWF